MKKLVLAGLVIVLFFAGLSAQDTTQAVYKNSAERLLSSDQRLKIGGYAQIDYNQPFGGNQLNNGNLDVHRLVLLFGYKFNERTQFITEVEYEHVSEVYVEQAFLDYRINNYLNFRGGLILVPYGIINEYHEPPAYNGVERPNIDGKIAPTTWRELGAGFTGTFPGAALKYQAYVVNGFKSFDGTARLDGSNGLRKGRQKGAESFMSSPNFTGKVEYFGIKGLNLGLSGYFGKTQSTLYNGIDKNDSDMKMRADSSVVSLSMAGVDARYDIKGVTFKTQFYFISLGNSEVYNEFALANGGKGDLGSSMLGYYAELGYNVFTSLEGVESELVPFVRYESYNTHNSVSGDLVRNDAYNATCITAGLGWKITKNAVLKADIQLLNTAANKDFTNIFNAGIGVMF